MTMLKKESSDLAYIELNTDNPYDLFKIWYKEACTFSTGMPNALCLATISKDMKVSARHVVLRKLEQDGFVIFTDNRSRKTKDLQLNKGTHDKVRIEGDMVVLPKESYLDLYDKDKLFCKIRSYICQQDKEVDWDDLKERHDQLLHEVQTNKKSLPMPDHFIGYKMLPKSIEFYFARDHLIGDRILFEKSTTPSTWKHKRIAA